MGMKDQESEDLGATPPLNGSPLSEREIRSQFRKAAKRLGINRLSKQSGFGINTVRRLIYNERVHDGTLATARELLGDPLWAQLGRSGRSIGRALLSDRDDLSREATALEYESMALRHEASAKKFRALALRERSKNEEPEPEPELERGIDLNSALFEDDLEPDE